MNAVIQRLFRIDWQRYQTYCRIAILLLGVAALVSCIVVRVSGDSLWPIRDGDTLIVVRWLNPKRGDIVLFNTEEGWCVKRVAATAGDVWNRQPVPIGYVYLEGTNNSVEVGLVELKNVVGVAKHLCFTGTEEQKKPELPQTPAAEPSPPSSVTINSTEVMRYRVDMNISMDGFLAVRGNLTNDYIGGRFVYDENNGKSYRVSRSSLIFRDSIQEYVTAVEVEGGYSSPVSGHNVHLIDRWVADGTPAE